MRAMFSCLPSVGHLHAIVPLARAVQETGHDVVVVTSPAFTATVEETGLRAVGAGLDWLESEVERGFPDLVRDVSDVYTNRHFWPMAFVRAARTLLPEMLRLLTSLRPDVVLSEGLDYAAPLAAEAIGIPHARWSIEAYRPQRLVAGTLGPVWNQTRIELGLLPDPQLDRLCPSLYLDLYPPCLQRVPPQELPPVCRSLRPEPFLPGGDEAPDRLAPQEGRPTVLVTLGTIFNRAEGALELLVEALAGEPVNVVAAIGANRDPASLGPQPGNVRVERYVSLPAVLDRA